MVETLRHIDHELFRAINSENTNLLFDAILPIAREKTIWIPVYLGIAYLAFAHYGKKVIWLGIIAGIMILLSDQVSSSLIKPYFHRLRPCNNPGMDVRLLLEHCGNGFSFVSSHAANHFALATFLSFIVVRKTWIPALFLWAFTIAYAQVYVGVHFPLDVAAGGILGIVLGLLAGLVAKKVALRT